MKLSANRSLIPRITVPKRTERFVSSFSELSSWQHRLFCGGASVGIQYGVESNNKLVDDKTRKISATRTATKLTVGTISGVLVRFIAQNAGEIWYKPPKNIPKDLAKKMPKAFGNVLAIAATIVTALTVEPAMTDKILNKIITSRRVGSLSHQR